MYGRHSTTTDHKDCSPVVLYASVGRRCCASISFLQLPPIVIIQPGLSWQRLGTLCTKVLMCDGKLIDAFCQDTGQLFAVKVFSLLDREKRRQLDREIGTLLRSMQDGYAIQATVLPPHPLSSLWCWIGSAMTQDLNISDLCMLLVAYVLRHF